MLSMLRLGGWEEEFRLCLKAPESGGTGSLWGKDVR